ncbi:MAG TPA: FAD-binding oxidoreductase [Actinotalea sp.]|nr:FAD-binding oxidoreductase [Actinotalea sp.]
MTALDLQVLSSRLDGRLVMPGSPDFAAASTVLAGPGEPVGVVQAASVADVVAAVSTARTLGVPVAVRSGGHGVWELVPGALVIDLHQVAEVRADPPRQDGTAVVHVGGGATWGTVASALAPLGLAVSSGDTRSVGVGGLSLGAGIGWMVRAWGLTVDQLVGAQVVTASGDVVEASATTEPDLFWALRGGGGNFGVVTRFDLVAHPLNGVVRCTLGFGPDADRGAVLRAFRDVMREAPRELNGSLVVPPAFGPEPLPSTLLALAWAGTDERAARAAVEPLLALPGLTSAEVGPAAYLDLLDEHGGPPPGVARPVMVDQNGFLGPFNDAAVDAAVGTVAAGAQLLRVRWLGGAFADVPPSATAVAHRQAEAFVVAAAFAPPDADATHVALLHEALAPIAAHSLGAYGNFTTSVAPEFVTRMYPPATMARLQAIKAVWDPGNLFSRNHNVTPARS